MKKSLVAFLFALILLFGFTILAVTQEDIEASNMGDFNETSIMTDALQSVL